MGLKDRIKNKLNDGNKEKEEKVNYPPEMLEEACGHAKALAALPQDVIYYALGHTCGPTSPALPSAIIDTAATLLAIMPNNVPGFKRAVKQYMKKFGSEDSSLMLDMFMDETPDGQRRCVVNIGSDTEMVALGLAAAAAGRPELEDIIFAAAGQYIHLLKKPSERDKALKRLLSRVQLTEAGSGWTIVSPDKEDLVEESGKAARRKEEGKKGKKRS